jgi:xylulokinase
MNTTRPFTSIDDCTVGVDLGTTNLKAALFDSEGSLLASAEEALEMHREGRDRVEQDPDAWWSALKKVLRALVQASPEAKVVGIAICAQVGSHVFVDADGRAVTRAWLWQDARCQPVVAELNGRAAATDAALPPGFLVDNAAAIARARWLEDQEPETWARVAYVLNPKDYLNLRLSGAIASDGMSQYGLVDDDGEYFPGLDAVVPGVTRIFPEVQDFRASLGRVQKLNDPVLDVALSGAVVGVGTMDVYGNLFGSGADSDGSAIEVSGTCEIAGILSPLDQDPSGVVKFPPIDGLRLYAGPTKSGGSAVQWFAGVLQVSVPELMSLAASSADDADPLIFQAYLEGERAPLWDDDVRGSFFGLSARHSRADMARAVVEGVALTGRAVLLAAETSSGRRAEKVRLSGGGAQSDIACQIRADVLGRPVERVTVKNTGVLGAALLAAVAAGATTSISDAARQLVHVDRTFYPAEEKRARYEAIVAVYDQLYSALESANGAMAQLRRA